MSDPKVTVIDTTPDYDSLISRFVTLAVQRIRARMRSKMREPKSGRLYRTSKGEGFATSHRASAPGEAPANWSFELSNSLTIESNGIEAQLYTTLGYAVDLEFGSIEKRIKPRPMWQASLDEEMPFLEQELARVLS